MRCRGEPARILERGMHHLSPIALADDLAAIGRLFGFGPTSIAAPQAIDATDRDDRCLPARHGIRTSKPGCTTS
ncbi:hypothetical protein MJ579_06640 [Klebsiella pneumoniae]|nr:hypothetical protein MJ579_06640 [Klebsiella pneumoniae]